SRRRHTRFSRDWSSDVCSSDLPPPAFMRRRVVVGKAGGARSALELAEGFQGAHRIHISGAGIERHRGAQRLGDFLGGGAGLLRQIGRASWRERVEDTVPAVATN